MSITETQNIHAKKSIAGNVFDWIHIFFVAIIIAGVLNSFVFQLIRIEQTSMVPTFFSGEKVLLSKAALWFDEPKSGDIVVFYDITSNQNLIKRVIGVPGDTIEIKDHAVYRNGTKLNEPYLRETMNGSMSEIVIPSGKYFCLGDNRNVSIDSRSIGPIAIDKILGKVIFRFEGFTSVSSYDHSYADLK